MQFPLPQSQRVWAYRLRPTRWGHRIYFTLGSSLVHEKWVFGNSERAHARAQRFISHVKEYERKARERSFR